MPIIKGEMRPWQHGIAMEELKRVCKVFTSFDKGMVFGAFGKVKENTVADWIFKEKLETVVEDGKVVATVAFQITKQQRAVSGFARDCGVPLKGSLQIVRMACLPGAEQLLVDSIETIAEDCPEIWVRTWVESQQARQVCEALGASWIDTKVMASSDLIGIFYRGQQRPRGSSKQDKITLQKLAVSVPSSSIKKALAEIEKVGPEYAQHYSTYNKRGTWKALTLRGFGGDPLFIIKPEEMSKGWKAENPERLDAECIDTPLRAKLKSLEPLISLVPGKKERIRLMALAPGGGELARHADITDKDAGTKEGCLMRIHIPLITNKDVIFTQWTLEGEQLHASMKIGEAWYLDTRKPHKACNGGGTERVHLVMDVVANPDLLKLLGV